MAKARCVNVAGFDAFAFAVLRLVAVRSADGAIVYSAVLAWYFSVSFHQLLAAHVLKFFYH
jgi:hypothetical protein